MIAIMPKSEIKDGDRKIVSWNHTSTGAESLFLLRNQLIMKVRHEWLW